MSFALTTAARAQSLSALDLKYMSFDRRQCIIVFHIQKLLKTSRPGVSLPNGYNVHKNFKTVLTSYVHE
jgi:hypothetical protein